MQNQRSAHELDEDTSETTRTVKRSRIEPSSSQPTSPAGQSESESASGGEIDSDDDLVLSEVHINPKNGRVDGRLLSSIFHLKPSVALSDGQPQDEESENGSAWEFGIEIQHAMGTPLKDVDWMVSIQNQLNGSVVLELGAGTGLASITLGLMTNVAKVFCTDHGTEVLSNCEQNIALNKELLLSESSEPSELDRRVLPRRLNWLMQDPMDSIAEQPDQFDWSREEREEWRTKGSFIFAADVVYDDSLTDALIETLEKLLVEPLPESHEFHAAGRVAFVTMEKRYNFSLDHLDVVAQAHEYFVERIRRSDVLDAIRVDCSQLVRQCNYERSKDLELYRVCHKQS
ncbi:Methyltransferase-like protein 22 [Mortierella sp. NVP85]|nr:Methyltransferase-like protein 22 [Mortierella sp. NVP85]